MEHPLDVDIMAAIIYFKGNEDRIINVLARRVSGEDEAAAAKTISKGYYSAPGFKTVSEKAPRVFIMHRLVELMDDGKIRWNGEAWECLEPEKPKKRGHLRMF